MHILSMSLQVFASRLNPLSKQSIYTIYGAAREAKVHRRRAPKNVVTDRRDKARNNRSGSNYFTTVCSLKRYGLKLQGKD
jgi:hypothetical protein